MAEPKANEAKFYTKETFSQFVWNPATNQLFGRTALSWSKIFLFYVVFYSCLAGFFAGMFWCFYQTLDPYHMPKYTPGDGDSILRHAAMGYRPLPRRDNIDSTLIWFNSSSEYDDMRRHYTHSLDQFIRRYEDYGSISGQHIVQCSDEYFPMHGEVCSFRDTWLTDKCKKVEKWGYDKGTPCVLLKMNRMINWVPDVYETLDELPMHMPRSLRETIRQSVTDNDGRMPKMIWVSCSGEYPADSEDIGPIKYSPWQGFPAYYFPFTNIPGYLPPIVAVQFDNPQPNVLINIECRAWAKNIVHYRKNRLGLVHFELLMD